MSYGRLPLVFAVLATSLAGCPSQNGEAPPVPTQATPSPSAPGAHDTEEAEAVTAPPIADPIPLANVGAPTPAQLGAFASATNAFAIDLYAKAREREGNLAFSPASIELALGMTWAGARGPTADEMRRVLHIEGEADALHESASRILASWNDASRDTYELRVVNRLFGEATYTFEQPYLDLVSTRYGAPLSRVDFRNAYEAQRGLINEWVEHQTNERIHELLPAGSLNDLTRLVLVNAVYFLGQWVTEFPESATRDDFFHVQGGGRAPVRMMQLTHEHRYAEVGDAQVLQMPYRGGDLGMMLVLPRETGGLSALEASLDASTLAGWVRALREQDVEVHLPRFTIENAALPLTEMLPAMGMGLAFDPAHADFTGMARPASSDELLYISAVFHQAFVKVDERGTEATAATAVVMASRGRAAPPPTELAVFRADHPFLFLIRDLRSGAVLFMGRVTNPR